MILSRSQLLGATKRRYLNVPIPDGIELPDGHITCGDFVRIRSLTAGEIDRFESTSIRSNKAGDKALLNWEALEDHRRRLMRMVLVDENNNTLLTPEDDPAIVGVDGIIIVDVYRDACKFTGIKERDEQIEKNLSGTPAAAKPGN